MYHLTAKSANVKTGPIPVSTSTHDTCPDICPLKAKGCYAGSGPLALHWRKVTEGSRGVSWLNFVQLIAALPENQTWRHNQAGDLIPMEHNKEIVSGVALQELVEANKGKQGFTYTHYNPRLAHNASMISYANREGFTINLSANTIAEADEYKALDIGPVVTILPIEYQRTMHKKEYTETLKEYAERMKGKCITDAGNAITVCPATFMEDVSCATCKLCARDSRGTIVGFPAHGTQKKAANLIARG